MRPDRLVALWLFDHVPLLGPLERFAPWVLGYGLGSRPRRVIEDDADDPAAEVEA